MFRDSILFIDWDGTLCHSRFWSLNQDICEKAQEPLFQKNQALVHEWMRGEKSAEQVCEWLAQEIGEDYQLIWDGLAESCRNMEFSEIARELINTIKQRSYVALVTDNMDCFSKITVPALSLNQVFDKILNSYELRKMKNYENGSVYSDYAKFKNIPLSKTHLIDDSTKTCDLFKTLGGEAHRTKGVLETIEILKGF